MKATQEPQRINSQEELDILIENQKHGNPLPCFVKLNFGFKSSKDISFTDGGDYFIYNEIDGSEETIDHDELMSSFIGEALEKGALYKY